MIVLEFDKAASLYAADPEVLRFMASFARAEFALKKTPGLATAGRRDAAMPDWDELANQVAAAFDIALAEGKFPRIADVKALLANPPRVQRFREEFFDWIDAPLGEGSDALRASLALRRVRNNLFHGGKDLTRDRERTLTFVRRALATLELFLTLHNDFAFNFTLPIPPPR